MNNRQLPEGMTRRGRVYWADFRVNGRRIRKSLSTNSKTAKQLLIELRARAERRDYNLMDNNTGLTEIKGLFIKHCQQTLKPETVSLYERRLAAILPHMAPKVTQLTAPAILAYREHRLALGRSAGTVNGEVAVLGILLNWAVDPGRLIGENPIKGVRQLPENPKETRPLTKEEADRLLAFSSPHWRDVWYAFLVTGLRSNELAQLRFDAIDWENREIIVRRGVAKNHCSRRIPIDDGLWEILTDRATQREHRQPSTIKGPRGDRMRQRFTRDHVFTTVENTPLDVRTAVLNRFLACCRKAGISTLDVSPDGETVQHVDVHSLRATFATDLIVNGADPKTVQELMGHKTLEMTMNIYTKVHTGTKRQAIGRLSYGRGASPGEHIVELTAASGHRMSTVERDVDAKPCTAMA